VTDNARVFRLCEGISFQQLGNEEGAIVLVIDTGQIYTCNVTTARFLAAVDGRRTFAQVVDEVGNTFEVAHEELRRDLSAMADELVAEGLIQQSD
jgi:Coenzyme PQQ synthesis protein D (PqqD)